jgi:hypothetical protein
MSSAQTWSASYVNVEREWNRYTFEQIESLLGKGMFYKLKTKEKNGMLLLPSYKTDADTDYGDLLSISGVYGCIKREQTTLKKVNEYLMNLSDESTCDTLIVCQLQICTYFYQDNIAGIEGMDKKPIKVGKMYMGSDTNDCEYVTKRLIEKYGKK